MELYGRAAAEIYHLILDLERKVLYLLTRHSRRLSIYI